jgi:stage II sporulation protein D
METAGQVLRYDGALIEATYFSCSGGMTEDAAAVWGSDLPYLQSTPSPGEEKAEHFTDTVTFTAEEFARRLDIAPEGLPATWFSEPVYTDGGGILTMEIGGVTFKGTTLRQLLGLNSTAFILSAVGDTITVTTKGFGHRVGMSQYGADAMAVQGSTYEQILLHYYRGTTLEAYSAED